MQTQTEAQKLLTDGGGPWLEAMIWSGIGVQQLLRIIYAGTRTVFQGAGRSNAAYRSQQESSFDAGIILQAGAQGTSSYAQI